MSGWSVHPQASNDTAGIDRIGVETFRAPTDQPEADGTPAYGSGGFIPAAHERGAPPVNPDRSMR